MFERLFRTRDGTVLYAVIRREVGYEVVEWSARDALAPLVLAQYRRDQKHEAVGYAQRLAGGGC